MKILIIEDDERIAQPLIEELKHQNYVVDFAADGELGLDMATAGQYDVILLDLMLPKLNGVALCQQLRDSGNTSSILMLTARGDKEDKIHGLDAGADDYLTKPFDIDELLARIRALSRRGSTQRKTVLDVGNLHIDTRNCEVTYGEEKVDLTPTEYRIIVLFARNPSIIFKGEDLIDRLWSFEDAPGKEAVKTHIKTLRRKLESAGASRDLIETVYGFGYRMKG